MVASALAEYEGYSLEGYEGYHHQPIIHHQPLEEHHSEEYDLDYHVSTTRPQCDVSSAYTYLYRISPKE